MKKADKWSKINRRLTDGNSSLPPVGRSVGFHKTPVGRALRRWNALCGVLLHHILPALVFATQSPYSGWQNVANLERYAKGKLKRFENT